MDWCPQPVVLACECSLLGCREQECQGRCGCPACELPNFEPEIVGYRNRCSQCGYPLKEAVPGPAFCTDGCAEIWASLVAG